MAVMNLEYIKKMVNIFADTHMPFKDLIEPVIRGYNQLTEEEQKQFCKWLAGPPARGLRRDADILEDACTMAQDEIDAIVDDYSKLPF